jgi:hypothetical protein
MYGTFVSIYNELYRVDHDMDHCSFLDSTADYQSGASALGAQPKKPQPFAPFRSPGEYNGITLRVEPPRTIPPTAIPDIALPLILFDEQETSHAACGRT